MVRLYGKRLTPVVGCGATVDPSPGLGNIYACKYRMLPGTRPELDVADVELPQR
jgi:hypothetical protein